MAYTTYGNPAATSLRARVAARFDTFKTDWAKWRTYRRTLNELSTLSNRDLDDLGLSRSMIRSVAIEAAYGKK
ncbi:MAG: DUF1127 domain-containing protein [Pseudomonadota bacterium]